MSFEKDENPMNPQIDEMVRMGREAGLKTVFKRVVDGIKGFDSEKWDAL